MPLYHVQDDDCPCWIVATSLSDAVAKFRHAVREADIEGYATDEDVPEPLGVTLVCPDAELILNGDGVAPSLLRELRGLVEEITGLIEESDGVTGLHLNGDVAPWDELVQGGRFERLLHIQSAIEAIDKATKS